jgi:hypothetical protein
MIIPTFTILRWTHHGQRPTPPIRASERANANARRTAKTAFRQASFDLLASGYSLEQIAAARKVSVRTIKREIDSVIAQRRLDAPDRYIHLQVARLAKALRLADAAIERGDLKAVQALVKVVSSLDRYHGLNQRLSSHARPGSFAVLAPPVAPALPPPALDLARISPPAAGREPDGAPAGGPADDSENVTGFGA